MAAGESLVAAQIIALAAVTGGLAVAPNDGARFPVRPMTGFPGRQSLTGAVRACDHAMC